MSFLSEDPQPTVRLEEHSNSLLAQFDTQLQVIANRYLTFFHERRNIEATYIASLRRLHRKAKTVDASSFDPGAEPTTTRAAWDKVRDNLERGAGFRNLNPNCGLEPTVIAEAKTQQCFVDILDNDVIKPLVALKESTDETRKRIGEDLKGSAARYAEYAENRISKLQQAYFKKLHPQQYANFIEDSQRPQNVPNKRFGDKVAALFRGLWEPEPARPSTSREVSDDDCRGAISYLNNLRVMRAESLENGYDCLEEFVFTPTVKNVLVNYMDGMAKTCTTHHDLAMSTKAEVEEALAGTDTSDLRTSFRRELSHSIPPPIFYRNYYRPGAYSDPVFGVPLVEVETNEDKVPKVMRMCIEEVEKRGLNTNGIYSLRRRFESEKLFSFSSTDNIHSVAALLELYLFDLPEPLFMLSLQDYRNYRQTRARFPENNFSLLRSKIRELHPIHRASLCALLRHLLCVSTHSDTNATTVQALAGYLRYVVLRGGAVMQDGGLVLEDLIQNAKTLFDERPSSPSPIPSSSVAEATSAYAYSSLISSPQPSEVQVVGRSTLNRPGLGGIPTSTQSSFLSSPSDAAMGCITLSQTPTEGAEMTAQEQVVPQARGTETMETLLNNTPPGAMPVPSTNVAEWLRQLRVPPNPEPLTIPQSPPETVLYSTSDFSHSSATSLRTAMGPFSP
ncbi:hypothetical protein EDB89DRAFT_2076851 [Lactarius sanguifluus]|nr:hypothetical protein EDB89DRAFT_2076851 [Lactarius sanguifluus]